MGEAKSTCVVKTLLVLLSFNYSHIHVITLKYFYFGLNKCNARQLLFGISVHCP